MTDRPEAVSLEELWRRMAERPGLENRELDLGLQVPLVIGCTTDCRPYIMLLSEDQPKALIDLEAVDVRIGRRTSPIGEDWSLTFVLRDWSLLHAFAEICLAFAERIRSAASKNAALREIYATVDQWQRLLRAVRTGDRLSVLRGVCGELIAGLEIMKLTGRPAEIVYGAWTGPYGAPQDYSFDSERRYWEVKTIHGSAKRLAISSPEQLDTSIGRIDLLTVVLDAPTGGNGERLVSLPRIVELVRRAADDPYQVGQCIANGLDELGVDPYSDIARHTMFAVGPVRAYGVVDGFPRITPPIPDGVTGLTYAVERGAIESFATGCDMNVMDGVAA